LCFTSPTGINDSGSIVGQFCDGAGCHGFLIPKCNGQAISLPPPGQFSANGWSGAYSISAQDGLELRDVQLQVPVPQALQQSGLQLPGTRYMAERMNVPYFKLKTTDFDSGVVPGGHCELRPDGSSPDSDTSRVACRSKLVDFVNAGNSLEATFE